jgi:alkylated DNA repair dioxygenase AlkB
LFDDGPQAIPLPDGELWLYPDFAAGDADSLPMLIAETPWRSDTIQLFGKRYLQPRLTAWYGDPGCRYTYSRLRLEPLPWTPLLARFRDRVGAAADAPFNSVLLNYYRDERDSMGMHADDEPELGPAPVIASVSLGERRNLVLRHRHDRSVDSLRLPLEHGSLLIMRGATQRNWKHGIEKERRPCGPRVNLTFRQILQNRSLGQSQGSDG